VAVAWPETVSQLDSMWLPVHPIWRLNGSSDFQTTQRFTSTNRTLAKPAARERKQIGNKHPALLIYLPDRSRLD